MRWRGGRHCADSACAVATGDRQRAGVRRAHTSIGHYFLQLLLSDQDLLGDRWVNRPWNNYFNLTIIVVLFALSLVLAAQVILPNLFQS